MEDPLTVVGTLHGPGPRLRPLGQMTTTYRLPFGPWYLPSRQSPVVSSVADLVATTETRDSSVSGESRSTEFLGGTSGMDRVSPRPRLPGEDPVSVGTLR